MFSFRKTSYSSEATTLDIAPDEQAPTVGAVREVLRETPAPRKRVLLLDDMADYREVLQDYLDSYRFNVTGVNNGAEGLREIMKDPFDLILCDMMMPKLNGEMFYWAVHRLRPAACYRFIFLTGHQNRPTVQAFFERAKAVVLVKPFPLDDLRRVMGEVLRKVG